MRFCLKISNSWRRVCKHSLKGFKRRSKYNISWTNKGPRKKEKKKKQIQDRIHQVYKYPTASKTALGLNRKKYIFVNKTEKWKCSPGQKTTVFKVVLCIETLSQPHQRVLMTPLGEHNRSVSTRREEVVQYVAGWKAESVMWPVASDQQGYSQFKHNGETSHSRSVFSLKDVCGVAWVVPAR